MSRPARELGLSLARLMRPQNTRFSVLFFAFPQLGSTFALSHLLGGAMLIIALYGLCTAANDLSDVPTDRTNQRDLPLARRELNQRQALGLAGALALVALLLNLLLPQPETLVYSILMLSIGLSYSLPPLRLSHRGLLGTVALGICYVGLPLYLGSQFADVAASRNLWLLVGSAVLLAGPPLLYKDFKDEVGDRQHGKHTPLVRYGSTAVKALTITFCLAGYALLILASIGLFIPWIVGTCGAAVAVLVLAARKDALRPKLLLLYLLIVTGMVVLSFTSLSK